MRLTKDEFRIWLSQQVAKYCKIDPSAIDENENFSKYGLDSVFAFSLGGDVEEVLEGILR